jgi:hypothetical protein
MRGTLKGSPLATNPNRTVQHRVHRERHDAANQRAALRSLMLLSGENGVVKSALARRWLRSLESKAYFPVCITQASLTGIGLLSLLD